MKNEAAALRPLDNPVDRYKARHALERVVRFEGVNSLTIIKQDEWLAVPVESGYHFSDADQRQLLQAIVDNGDHRIFAMALESLGDNLSIYEVSPSREGLSAFNHRFGHFNFVLLTEEPSWIVICTTSEYFIIAGNSDFVRRALGGELDANFVHFQEFASDMRWPESVRNHLLFVLNVLQKEYMQAETGASVKII